MEAAIVKAACAIGAGIAMGFGAIGPAIGEGNAVGKALLAKMQHRATLPTVTRMADVKALSPEGQALFRLESRCTDLYALGAKKPLPGGAEQRLQIVST